MSNIVIVGSGPAGVSAALYAVRAGMQTTVLTKGSAQKCFCDPVTEICAALVYNKGKESGKGATPCPISLS